MQIELFSKPDCNFCEIAEDNLQRKKLKYSKKILDENYEIKDVEEITGKSKDDIIFPVCVVDGEYIGNAKDLHMYIRKALRSKK